MGAPGVYRRGNNHCLLASSSSQDATIKSHAIISKARPTTLHGCKGISLNLNHQKPFIIFFQDIQMFQMRQLHLKPGCSLRPQTHFESSDTHGLWDNSIELIKISVFPIKGFDLIYCTNGRSLLNPWHNKHQVQYKGSAWINIGTQCFHMTSYIPRYNHKLS